MCKKEEEENEMLANTIDKKIPSSRKPNVIKALGEVEMIRNGKLPRKTARDFLKDSRKQ